MRSRQPSATRATRLRFEPLEPRVMLHGDGLDDAGPAASVDSVLVVDDLTEVNLSISQQIITAGSLQTAALDSIPLLHSNASSPVKLFLDFDGHFDSQWGGYSNVTTPAYDIDGDATSFSQQELDNITEVWQRVSEDFAPFNIDVTTEDPQDFRDGVGMRVAIGGNGLWVGGYYGGVAYVNTFSYSSIVNTVYVFSDNLYNAKNIAEASSHEAGHSFGLWHQSSYDSNGNKTSEYSSGSGNWAPIMGNSYSKVLSTWHNGPNGSGSTSYQDDLAIIAGQNNGFGYRPDDHGGSAAAADDLSVSGTVVSAAGIVEQNSDSDWFSFWTSAGQIDLTVDVAAVGANLDAVLELRDSNGQLMATSDPSATLGATISANVDAGEYFLVVRSTGTYGHIGTYTVSGTIASMPTGFSFEGSNLVVSGTSGNDLLRVEGGSTHRLTLNGTMTEVPADRVVAILFDGGAGYDRVNLSDSVGISMSSTTTGGGQAVAASYLVDMTNVSQIAVWNNVDNMPYIYDVHDGGVGDVSRMVTREDLERLSGNNSHRSTLHERLSNGRRDAGPSSVTPVNPANTRVDQVHTLARFAGSGQRQDNTLTDNQASPHSFFNSLDSSFAEILENAADDSDFDLAVLKGGRSTDADVRLLDNLYERAGGADWLL